MDDTYTAWDGNQYAWPPPDGWYEAEDGRYWAPATGPNLATSPFDQAEVPVSKPSSPDLVGSDFASSDFASPAAPANEPMVAAASIPIALSDGPIQDLASNNQGGAFADDVIDSIFDRPSPTNSIFELPLLESPEETPEPVVSDGVLYPAGRAVTSEESRLESVFSETTVFGDPPSDMAPLSPSTSALDHPTNESPLSNPVPMPPSEVASTNGLVSHDADTSDQIQPSESSSTSTPVAGASTSNGVPLAEELSTQTTNAARPDGVFTTPNSAASSGSIPAENRAQPTESLFESTLREPPMAVNTQVAPPNAYDPYGDPRIARLELDDFEGSGRTWALGIMAVAAAGLIAVAGIFTFTDVFGGDDSETAATDDDVASPITSAEGSQAPTDGGSTASSTDASALNANSPDDATDATLDTQDPSAGPDTTDNGSVDSDSNNPTGTSVLAADSTQLVDDFRLRLTNNGLTTGSLLPYELTNFGNSFCGFARESATTTEFSEVRARAIENATSDLAINELNLVIDAAIVTFCPAEADRLGISAGNLQIDDDEDNDEDDDS